jgi:hypothetical protein
MNASIRAIGVIRVIRVIPRHSRPFPAIPGHSRSFPVIPRHPRGSDPVSTPANKVRVTESKHRQATLFTRAVSHWQKEIHMPIETYNNNPALRPTVLARDVLKNVYRPSGPVAVPSQSNEKETARETNRAA